MYLRVNRGTKWIKETSAQIHLFLFPNLFKLFASPWSHFTPLNWGVGWAQQAAWWCPTKSCSHSCQGLLSRTADLLAWPRHRICTVHLYRAPRTLPFRTQSYWAGSHLSSGLTPQNSRYLLVVLSFGKKASKQERWLTDIASANQANKTLEHSFEVCVTSR